MEKTTVLAMSQILEGYISRKKIKPVIGFNVFRQALQSSDNDEEIMGNFIDQLEDYAEIERRLSWIECLG